MQQIIVIDGHDGSGKTTLAKMLAAETGGTYLKPYSGEIGSYLDWLYQFKRWKDADFLSRLAVEKILTENSAKKLLILDRCWMTLFTVIPTESYSNWYPIIKNMNTILIWTNLSTTLERLKIRDEFDKYQSDHEYYINKFKEIGNEFKVSRIDTTQTSVDESFYQLLVRLKERSVL
jgi:thymidylate kinase